MITSSPLDASADDKLPPDTDDSTSSARAVRFVVSSVGTMITCTTTGVPSSPEFSAPVTSSSDASSPNTSASASTSVSCIVRFSPSTSPSLSPIDVTTPHTTVAAASNPASNVRLY